jgi:uncharacterized membrane protein
MQIKQSSQHLVLRDSPGCFWLLGMLFVVIGGLFAAGSLGLFTNAHTLSLWQRLLVLVMGSIGVGVGLGVIIQAPQTVSVFDRQTQQAVITRRGLLGRTVSIYSLADITCVQIREHTDSEGSPVFQLELVLRSRQPVPLSRLWMHHRPAHEQAMSRVNDFLVHSRL